MFFVNNIKSCFKLLTGDNSFTTKNKERYIIKRYVFSFILFLKSFVIGLKFLSFYFILFYIFLFNSSFYLLVFFVSFYIILYYFIILLHLFFALLTIIWFNLIAMLNINFFKSFLITWLYLVIFFIIKEFINLVYLVFYMLLKCLYFLKKLFYYYFYFIIIFLFYFITYIILLLIYFFYINFNYNKLMVILKLIYYFDITFFLYNLKIYKYLSNLKFYKELQNFKEKKIIQIKKLIKIFIQTSKQFLLKAWKQFKLVLISFFELFLFLKKLTVFEDRFVFFLWKDVPNEGYDYNNWKVEYTYQKYFLEQSYFSLSSYVSWRWYIFIYEFGIPFSQYVHEQQWRMELYEIKAFTELYLTEFEKTFYHFVFFFSSFFLFWDRKLNRHKFFFDLYSYLYFFCLKGLFLYYYNVNASYIFFSYYLKRYLNETEKNIINRVTDDKVIAFNMFVISLHKILNIILQLLFIIFIFYLKIKIIIKSIINILFKIWKFLKYFRYKKFNLYLFFINIPIYIYFIFKEIFFFFIFKKKYNIIYSYFLKKKNIKNLKKNFIFNINKTIKNKKFYKSSKDVYFSKYKSEQFYIFFSRFLTLRDIKYLVQCINEEKKINQILKENVDFSNINLNIDKLNFLDFLTGVTHEAWKPYKLYSNFLDWQEYQKYKKFLKYKKQKNKYLILLKKYDNKTKI